MFSRFVELRILFFLVNGLVLIKISREKIHLFLVACPQHIHIAVTLFFRRRSINRAFLVNFFP